MRRASLDRAEDDAAILERRDKCFVRRDRMAARCDDRAFSRDRVAATTVEILDVQPQSVTNFAAGEQNSLAVRKPVRPEIAVEPRMRNVPGLTRTDRKDAETERRQRLDDG